MIRLAPLAAFGAALAFGAAKPAVALDLDCTAYLAAVKSGPSAPIPVLPESLLTNTNTAIRCLIRTLDSLKDAAQATSVAEPVRNQFLSATGALRAIISKLNADDEKSPAGKALDGFIKTFRENVSTPVVSVLTYGVRSENYQMRSNSLLILANVIDNTTVCVPINHLWDPDLKKPDKDFSIRGRANLLAIVSVVAPWAYKENFENIQATKTYVWNNIDQADVTLRQTVEILTNIQKRLDSQTNETNRNVPLPAVLKSRCDEYSRTGPLWAPRDKIKY